MKLLLLLLLLLLLVLLLLLLLLRRSKRLRRVRRLRRLRRLLRRLRLCYDFQAAALCFSSRRACAKLDLAEVVKKETLRSEGVGSDHELRKEPYRTLWYRTYGCDLSSKHLQTCHFVVDPLHHHWSEIVRGQRKAPVDHEVLPEKISRLSSGGGFITMQVRTPKSAPQWVHSQGYGKPISSNLLPFHRLK